MPGFSLRSFAQHWLVRDRERRARRRGRGWRDLIGATFMFVMGLVRVIIEEKTPQILAAYRRYAWPSARAGDRNCPRRPGLAEPHGGRRRAGAASRVCPGVGDGKGIALMYVIIGRRCSSSADTRARARRLRMTCRTRRPLSETTNRLPERALTGAGRPAALEDSP